jgi:hypothetical protein
MLTAPYHDMRNEVYLKGSNHSVVVREWLAVVCLAALVSSLISSVQISACALPQTGTLATTLLVLL